MKRVEYDRHVYSPGYYAVAIAEPRGGAAADLVPLLYPHSKRLCGTECATYDQLWSRLPSSTPCLRHHRTLQYYSTVHFGIWSTLLRHWLRCIQVQTPVWYVEHVMRFFIKLNRLQSFTNRMNRMVKRGPSPSPG